VGKLGRFVASVRRVPRRTRAGDLSDTSPPPSPSPCPSPPLSPPFLSQGLHVSKKLLRFMIPPPRDNSWIGATLRASPGFCMCHRGAAA
jgi:hypothetical protein